MLSIEEEVGRGSSMNEKMNAMLGVKGLTILSVYLAQMSQSNTTDNTAPEQE